MTTMLFDTTRERSKMFTHLVICLLVAILGVGAYLYSTTLGVNYTRERDNIGNTYCLYWTPFRLSRRPSKMKATPCRAPILRSPANAPRRKAGRKTSRTGQARIDRAAAGALRVSHERIRT